MDAATDETSPEFDRFEFVLLKWPPRGENLTDEELDRLQEQHLTYLQSQIAAGTIRIAGPFEEQTDQSLRGLCFYQTGSLDRARALASADPAVLAGRLEVDVMYFYCPKGMLEGK